MRVLVSVLFLAVAVFAQDPQALVPSAPDNLSIPAQLWKTIDTKKCKTGDSVEMRTLEPVLIGNGLVMPENAKLHGRILGAASRQNDQPSWVVLVLERAEWKQHSIPLHAFIAAQITLKPTLTNRPFEDIMPGSVRRRRSGLIPTSAGRGASGVIGQPLQDAVVEGSNSAVISDQAPGGLHIAPGKNGTVFLVSQKPHLKISSGAMFMLRNHATAANAEPALTQVASTAQ